MPVRRIMIGQLTTSCPAVTQWALWRVGMKTRVVYTISCLRMCNVSCRLSVNVGSSRISRLVGDTDIDTGQQRNRRGCEVMRSPWIDAVDGKARSRSPCQVSYSLWLDGVLGRRELASAYVSVGDWGLLLVLHGSWDQCSGVAESNPESSSQAVSFCSRERKLLFPISHPFGILVL